MEPKGGSSAVVTAEVVREALGRRSDLSAVEEKVIRMRYGAGAGELKAPLPQAHADREELKDELLLLELQLLKAYRHHRAAQDAPRGRATALPSAGVDAKAKDKIVRALRKKKDR